MEKFVQKLYKILECIISFWIVQAQDGFLLQNAFQSLEKYSLNDPEVHDFDRRLLLVVVGFAGGRCVWVLRPIVHR